MRVRAVFTSPTLAKLVVAVGVCASPAWAQTVCNQPGPDVITGSLDVNSGSGFIFNSAAATIGGAWYDAFSFGTTSCNIGTQNILWQQSPDPNHPKIGQSFYKLKNGRLEQLGIGWAKHTFAAFQQNACCSCSNPGGLLQILQPGCSDPYTADRNATQTLLGPRWQINPYTGFGPGTPANPNTNLPPASLSRRVRVKSTDMEPSSATVKYYGEAQYITDSENGLNNQNNNASYRQCTVTGGPNEFTVNLTGVTVREKPAIRAWKINHPDVVETDIQLPGDGLLMLAARATDLGGGQWHYEYALHNLNSERGVQAFNVPLPDGAVITNIGFHDIDYHSGDAQNNFTNGSVNFSGVDWPGTVSTGSIGWATQTFAANINANAIRWGTMYNFRFDADLPPQSGNISLTTYKVVGTHTAATLVPAPDCNDNNIADSTDITNGTSVDANGNGIPDECEKNACPADINGSGGVDVTDLLAVVAAWGSGPGPADVNGDGNVDITDLLMVVGAWGACP